MAFTIIGSCCGIATARCVKDRVKHRSDTTVEGGGYITEITPRSREKNIARFVPIALGFLADITLMVALVVLSGLVVYQVGGIPLTKEIAWVFCGICTAETLLVLGVAKFHILPAIGRALDNE